MTATEVLCDNYLEPKTNFEWFVQCVNTLKYSQGFYSRIANKLYSMDEAELNALEQKLNSLEQKFKDNVDVIFYLEQ